MPAAARTRTRKAIACGPVQADNEGNEQPKSSSTAGTGPSFATESPMLLPYPPPPPLAQGKLPLS